MRARNRFDRRRSRARWVGRSAVPALALVVVLAGCGDDSDQTAADAPQGDTTSTSGPASSAPEDTEGLSGPEASASPSPTVTVDGVEANFHGKASVVGKDSMEIELDDFYFSPTVLVGSPGQQLTLTLSNEGDVSHTFTISTQDVDMVLQPGEEKDAQITFPDSDDQGFICRFHTDQGMVGRLVVES